MDGAQLRRAVLSAAALSSFLTSFMGASVVISLPAIGRDFDLNAVLLGWVATAYLLAAGMFLVPFGRFADIHGRKRVFTVGIAINTLASIALAGSTSPAMMIALRFVQGIGAAMIFGTSMAMLISVYPADERGKVLGISVTAVYLGLSLGPLVGGFLTHHLGWRSVFLSHVPLAAAVLYLILRRLKGEWAEAKGERFDLAGAIIYMIAVALFMNGLARLPSTPGIAMTAAGLAGLAVFAAWELRTPDPLLDIGLFRRNTVFAFSNLAALINYSATFAVGFLLSLYLQYIGKLTAQSAGLVLLWQPVVQALFSPFAGRLSDRIQPRIVTSIGMGLTVAGLLLLGFVGWTTSLTYVVACLVLLGLSFALFSSPNTNAVMSSVERHHYGLAAAILGSMRLTGQLLSMAIAMLIFSLYGLDRAQITPASYPVLLATVRMAFLIFAGLCLAGVFASLARGKLGRKAWRAVEG
ncbi:MAG TPA: MFS transporter [Planctomycetota bacterium]|nr:MFS transporter [Planctomycetota bacterium]HNU26596.1 MFS transporter [Planctomycetota bacterium]HOE29194.1 MFS transporter [Planctomycetota bacterium]HOE86470.1 MFS transporter [Planctomycetota bacterium]HOR66507.1 MFS transporter [Planctomycetota bacterium]